jgi:hypothetical protein
MATANERAVWAQMLTPLGWVLGAIALQARRTLLRELNGPERFLRLTEVASAWRMPGAAAPSIRKKHLLVLIPQAEEPVAPSPSRGRGAVHELTLMLPGGQITGRFQVGRGISPVGFLDRAGDFVVVEQARLRFPAGRLPVPVRAGVAIVNVEQVIAARSRGPRQA